MMLRGSFFFTFRDQIQSRTRDYDGLQFFVWTPFTFRVGARYWILEHCTKIISRIHSFINNNNSSHHQARTTTNSVQAEHKSCYIFFGFCFRLWIHFECVFIFRFGYIVLVFMLVETSVMFVLVFFLIISICTFVLFLIQC